MKVIAESWKSCKDVLIRRPATYFAIILYWLTSTNLQKITLNNTQKGCFLSPRCRITQKKVIAKSWENSKDVLIRRPATFFGTISNRLTSRNLPKTLNYKQYRLLFVHYVPYHAIKMIIESWKSPKDVLMRRPATNFATVFNWLRSTNLTKMLN